MCPAGDKSPVGLRQRPVQLLRHALVQRIRHAHVQTMHRSNPVPLEGPPRFAHVALFVGSMVCSWAAWYVTCLLLFYVISEASATFSKSSVVPELMAPHAVKPIGKRELKFGW